MVRKSLLFLIAIISGAAFYYFRPAAPLYFKVNCSIYDRQFQLVFQKAGFIFCDFADDGSLIAAEIDQPAKLFDKNDNLLRVSTRAVHHRLQFSPDQKNILTIVAQEVDFRGKKVKS